MKFSWSFLLRHLITKELCMRYLILLSFLLFNQAMALDSKEIVGMWKGQDTLHDFDFEFFFAQNGTFERRVASTFLGSVKADVFGIWKVKGEAVFDSSSHGWIVFTGASPIPIEPDTGF